MRNFRELDIWKNGIGLVKEIYLLLENFRISEKYGLTSQISRSAVSIPSNIAEVCSRESQKEFSRFLQIALGSSFELETQLIISNEIEFLSGPDFQNILGKLNVLQKQIHSLKKYADSQS